MDLIEELNTLFNQIAHYKDEVDSEQATIDAFVKPFVRLLGYDDANPTEVKPEYKADVGIKKGEKVDLAILKDGTTIMLIECKDWRVDISNEDTSKKHCSQLFRYFIAVQEARIGVLTNGIQYKFYADLKEPNRMDEDPFFEFDMSEIQPSLVDMLENFTKGNFDSDKIRSTAMYRKYQEEIKQILTKQLETPTADFVKFFYDAIKPQIARQGFTDVVKRAFYEFLDEQNEEELKGSDEQSEEEPKGGGVTPLKFTNLRVTMPDGNVIHHYSGKDTYIEVLEKLGLEEVMRVRPNIVSTEQFSLATKGIKRGRFWVRGVNGFSTNDRKVELEKIADRLGVSLLVERVEKTPKSG